MSDTTPTQTTATDTGSFFNSSAFHNHVRTWVFVILAIALIGFLYVHESNANAARNALAGQVVQQGQAQQASIDKQLQSIHQDTQNQVQQIQAQIQQVQTVAQAIASLKQSSPAPITITPLITTPATPTSPAVTTAAEKAQGTLPVATVDGDNLKVLADDLLTCKAQAVELSSCKDTVKLDGQKVDALTTENTALKRIKIEPAWKKTLKTVGQIALGALIGKVL